MNRRPTATVALAMLWGTALLASPVFAQPKPSDSPAQQAAGPATADADKADMADGEVRRIDKDAGRVTLKHGEIKSLDMPPMTMVFALRDKTLLDGLKAGDKVRFKAVNEAGRYTITSMQPAR